MNRKHKLLVIVALVIMAALMTGCLAGDSDFVEKPAGFFAGLWHGILCVLTFIISIFTDKVHMYEVNNVGVWYDLGFLIGASAALGGGGAGAGRRSKRDR